MLKKKALLLNSEETLKELEIDWRGQDFSFMIFNYKKVVFCQSAMGVWTDKLYFYLLQQDPKELSGIQGS